jgi:centrosomal protein CEP76
MAAWHTPATTITLRAGSTADHATLLCSLLRGFGLEAFVAVGTWMDAGGAEDTHEWVVTVDEEDGGQEAAGEGAPGEDAQHPSKSRSDGRPEVVFWEPMSGERYRPDWPTADGRRFVSIACLFNDRALLANVQRTSSVVECDWRVHEETLWSPLNTVAIADNASYLPPPIALAPPTVACGPVAHALEASLRHEVVAWRRQLGCSDPHFDSQLEHCLSPALAAYESERLTGRAFGTSEFRAAVRSCLPAGHAFNAFPFQVTHVSPAKIAAFLRASDVGKRVVSAGDHDAALAVRVRVFAYAEDVLAVWVIVASTAP